MPPWNIHLATDDLYLANLIYHRRETARIWWLVTPGMTQQGNQTLWRGKREGDTLLAKLRRTHSVATRDKNLTRVIHGLATRGLHHCGFCLQSGAFQHTLDRNTTFCAQVGPFRFALTWKLSPSFNASWAPLSNYVLLDPIKKDNRLSPTSWLTCYDCPDGCLHDPARNDGWSHQVLQKPLETFPIEEMSFSTYFFVRFDRNGGIIIQHHKRKLGPAIFLDILFHKLNRK